jgi:hypothetical protein
MKKMIQHFFWALFLLKFKKNKSEDIIMDVEN